MAELWTAHDRIARDLLPIWRGREIDKTDGMLLLFTGVDDAVGYALAYHRALVAAGLPFRARAGIHVGPITLRPNPAEDVARGAKPIEVDGLALPITARVMAVALGGQTLLSVDARLALGVTTKRTVSHGHWRMHGVADPVELFEIGEAEAPFVAPPDGAKVYRVVRQGDLWQPVREVRHSVPAERDSFVGRQESLQLIAKKLEGGARLISVLGIGGTGKTRLVTRFAWTRLGDYPGGVWFCDLSQARTVDGIHFAVAQGLDVPLGKTDPVVQLAHAIAGRGECLVILDNFEQVARHAEETLGRWLERAPQAKFIVTTREVLGIVGEETLALAPLSNVDAETLFWRRAESAKHDYLPSAEDHAAIKQLVMVLDGLPLAIELAAARVRVMPPRTMLARMHERFSLLWSGSGRRDRQATLRAAFDWSWELLSEPEKTALAQVSVFESGFTLESLEAVVRLPAAMGDRPWPVDVLQSLIAKSFVRQVTDDRYDLLETVRQYASEHLQTEGRFLYSGPLSSQEAEQRHGRFFATLGPQRALEHACAEADNLVVACKRAVARGDGLVATNALDGAWGALKLRGPFSVGIELASTVRSMPGLPTELAAVTGRIRGCALLFSGRIDEARRQLESATLEASEVSDRSLLAQLSADLAELWMREGNIAQALMYFEHALAGCAELDKSSVKCSALSGLGTCREYLGDLDAAQRHYEQALTVARETRERRWEGGALGNLGQLCATQGRVEQALAFYESAIDIANELGDRQWEANVRCNLGLLHCGEGRLDEAITHLKVALTASRELGHARLECVVLCNLGIASEAQGDLDLACENYASAVELARQLGERRYEGQFLGYLGRLHAKQVRFDSALECIETGADLLRAVSDRLSLGVLLCIKAETLQWSGDVLAAANLLGDAEQMVEELGVEPKSDLGIALARARASINRCTNAAGAG
ncbi:MAG: tetratricopeptide repeat protein [Burkholderiales bacterium]